jgi:hypothetical protein
MSTIVYSITDGMGSKSIIFRNKNFAMSDASRFVDLLNVPGHEIGHVPYIEPFLRPSLSHFGLKMHFAR